MEVRVVILGRVILRGRGVAVLLRLTVVYTGLSVVGRSRFRWCVLGELFWAIFVHVFRKSPRLVWADFLRCPFFLPLVVFVPFGRVAFVPWFVM